MIICLAGESITLTSPMAPFGVMPASPACVEAAVDVVVCAEALEPAGTNTSTSAMARKSAFITPPVVYENTANGRFIESWIIALNFAGYPCLLRSTRRECSG